MVRNVGSFKQNTKKQALVIGAGISGLLAARVLSDHFEGVVVVERDVFPDTLGTRVGTPQAFHVHRLLPRGKKILERLFLGYVEQLLAAGAYQIQGTLARMVKPFGLFQSRIPEEDASCSRSLLEREIRQRVQALPGVRFLSNHEVVGLQATPDGERITGVSVRARGRMDEISTLEADLVLDASGRSSKLTQWLPDLGYTLPAEAMVKADIGYSTRYYRAPAHVMDTFGALVVDELPDEGKSGVGILPIENDTLWVTLFSTGGKYPSIDVDVFEREITQLHRLGEEIAAALHESEPLGSPRGYRVPVCVRHHYEQAERWPAGLLAIGDALCHFDPIYGQGMTVAAIEAEALAVGLNEQRSTPLPDFERRTLQRLQNALAPVWWLSALSDLRGPHVTYEGVGKPLDVALLNRYLDLYYIYALEHPVEEAQSLSSDQPTFVKFILLNGLIVPPLAIFNVPTFTLLLEAEATSEGEQTLHKLVENYQLPPAEILEQVVPAFPLLI